MINYSHEICPTLAGGTHLYIHNHLSYKPRNGLCIYKGKELELSFIEISNPKRSNIIIGSIYRYANMDIDELNNNYLNILLDKHSKENKSVSFLVTLMLTFWNMITCTNKWPPGLVQPARISTTSKTLIDNIFSHIYTPSSISGNLTAQFHHPPQFFIVPDRF